MARDLLAGAATAALILAAGYDTALRHLDAEPLPPASPATAASRHEAGRAVYNFRCYFCHGYSGDAKTLATTYLMPPPRDFTRSALSRERIRQVLREGRDGTAMKSFAGILGEAEMEAVAAFVEQEFVVAKAPNTAYHTAANGWPAHERFEAAFPFARGVIALDAAPESLDARGQAGRRLFLASCISCHDRARVHDEGPAWSARPVSFPRMGFEPGQPNTAPVDAVSSASVYAKHEVPPPTEALSAAQRRGAALFQANCAFCHGADGTGKNWIGQFMEPKARDLTQYTLQTMPEATLRQRIREGLPGTSMPAWQHVLRPAEVRDLAHFVGTVLYQRRIEEPASHAAR
jgi:cytochrome c oxidase cbb3-type subunit 3